MATATHSQIKATATVNNPQSSNQRCVAGQSHLYGSLYVFSGAILRRPGPTTSSVHGYMTTHIDDHRSGFINVRTMTYNVAINDGRNDQLNGLGRDDDAVRATTVQSRVTQ